MGTEPFEVAITPNGSTAYVTNEADGTVSVINTTTNVATTSINIGLPDFFGIAITPDGAYVAYLSATEAAGTLRYADTASNTEFALTDINGGGPRSL